jgi:hypothetical protein
MKLLIFGSMGGVGRQVVEQATRGQDAVLLVLGPPALTKNTARSEGTKNVVRPGPFTNGARTGTYRHGLPGSDATIKAKISRADVADFMLKQVVNNTYLYKAPWVSY